MILSRVKLFNVGIIRDLIIECKPEDGAGVVVGIRGANGTGKSTVLHALAAVFEGGASPELIGPAADRYVIELEFDNGERYRREESGPDERGEYSYSVRGWYADGGKINAAPTRLKKLMADATAFNPTGLVDADPKERVKFLQAAMPLTFTRREVLEAIGDGSVPGIPDLLDATRFASFRDGRYEKRREVNVRVEQLRSTRKTLAESLPENDFLRFARTGSSDTQPELVATADAQALSIELDAAKDRLTEALRGWRGDYEAIIRQTHADELAEIEAVRQKWNAQRSEMHGRYEELVATERKPYDTEVERLAGELAAAEERATAEKRMQGVRDSIAELDRDIEAKELEAEALDKAVKSLDALKQRKLDSQPVPGVEIRNGRILVNGLDFDTQLNTAQQYLVSFQVAALTRGDDDLRLMLFDNSEALDGDNREAFVEGIKAAGFQVFMAEVATGEPLAVATV